MRKLPGLGTGRSRTRTAAAHSIVMAHRNGGEQDSDGGERGGIGRFDTEQQASRRRDVIAAPQKADGEAAEREADADLVRALRGGVRDDAIEAELPAE